MEQLVASLFGSTVTMAVPLLLAALGEVLAERSGTVDIGIEGKLLAGAFAAMATAMATGSPWLGVFAGALTGMALGGLSAYLIVVCAANQVVVGTAVNLLALGATGVAYRGLFGVTGAALTVQGLPAPHIPILADLPVLGTAFFSQTWLGYLSFAAVPAIGWFLSRTVPGLRLRAVGEDPLAADAQGISVGRVRTAALLASGALAGSAGAYLAVVYARTFVEGISGGRGFIALAIVVFGRWTPFGVLVGALVFGFATALQFHFQAMGLDVPYQFFLVLPYVMTIAILALVANRAVAPVALGQPYERGGT